MALLAGLVAWIVLRDDGSSSRRSASRTTVTAVSFSGLETLAASVGRPIYWAGAKPGFTYELTKTAGERVFIRYLPAGVPVGTKQPYLTIGTYPVADAFRSTRALAEKNGSVELNVGRGAVAFYGESAPTNVYVAYRGSDYQIEVYDPSAAVARQVVSSRRVQAVSAAATSVGAHVVSQAELEALAASLKHPLYWAGPRRGRKYELTETQGGSVYLRYLPRRAQVGVDKPYLTVGTYPVENAFAVTRSLSRKPGAVRLEVGEGGVGFYNKAQATNVYLAYPESDLQIEVYAPSPAAARAVVASRRVTPIR